MSHKSELEPVELSDDLNTKVLLRRSILFSQDRLLGERGARGFALCALVATVCGLYWYQHHMPLVSSLSQRPYHYALTKTFPLVQPKPVLDPAASLTPALPVAHVTVAHAQEAPDTLLLQHKVVLRKATLPVALPKRAMAMPRYTIQLVGSFDKGQVLRERSRLHIPQLHVFNEMYKQKGWYVLGIGTYNTQDQAQSALHRLPAKLRSEGAWVRHI